MNRNSLFYYFQDAEAQLSAKRGSDQEDPQQHSGHAHKSSWKHSAMIIVGNVVGTGLLGLPAAMARVGYGIGIGALVFFFFVALYAGLLLSRTRNLFFPKVMVFFGPLSLHSCFHSA